MFSVGIKVTIIASIDVILICFSVMTWRTRVVTWRGSVKKVLLKVLQKSQKNISAGVLFLIKIQAGDLPPRLHYWYYFVNSAKFLKTPFKNFERLLWKSLFVKFQVFPVKTNVLYISFNFFANLLFLRMSQETKTCSKNDKKRHKNCFSLCYSSFRPLLEMKMRDSMMESPREFAFSFRLW